MFNNLLVTTNFDCIFDCNNSIIIWSVVLIILIFLLSKLGHKLTISSFDVYMLKADHWIDTIVTLSDHIWYYYYDYRKFSFYLMVNV